MKKTITALLIGATLMGMTACSGGSSVTLTQRWDEDETQMATATVGYSGGTVVEDSSNEDEAQLINEEKDFSMEFYLYFDDDYEGFKEDASTEEGYKEVKYSGYEGYMYNYDEFEYEICLKLAEIDDENDVFLFAYVAPGSDLIDTETTDMEKIFNQKEVQDILNSIKYKGVKEVKAE